MSWEWHDCFSLIEISDPILHQIKIKILDQLLDLTAYGSVAVQFQSYTNYQNTERLMGGKWSLYEQLVALYRNVSRLAGDFLGGAIFKALCRA